MVITSRSNPTVKFFLSLHDKKNRRQSGLYLVEGIKPVNECIAAGLYIEKIICTERFSEHYPDATVVSVDVFGSVSDEKTPQGVMAAVRMPENVVCPPQNSCILLDRLQDPGNLGTIIRTANAAGFKEIYLIDCADPFSPKAVRASMSGIFFTKIYSGRREEVLNALKGIPIICADMHGEDIFGFTPPNKFCLCIGNEGSGIGDDIMSIAQYKISIPMDKTCESLNASVSAGIAMYLLKNAQNQEK